MAGTPEVLSPSEQSLSLEHLGVPLARQQAFCDMAQAWLGLTIDPMNLKNSSSSGIVNPEASSIGMTNEDLTTMIHLHMVISLEEILRDECLKNQQLIDTVNSILEQISSDFTHPDDHELFITLHQTIRNKFREPIIKHAHHAFVRTQMRDGRLQRLITQAKVYETGQNFFHDLDHVALTNIIINNFTIAICEFEQGNMSAAREQLGNIKNLWNQGKNIPHIQNLILGYQEEIIPGWTEKHCDIRSSLEQIAMSLARRFHLQTSLNGETISQSDQPNPSLSIGDISITIDMSIPQIVPVSTGVIERLAYNLLKNTLKAYDGRLKQEVQPDQLHIDIKVTTVGDAMCIIVADNGPGFDLNVPLPQLTEIVRKNPEYLQVIASEISPNVARMIQEYTLDQKPFAIYPMRLEDIFRVFLLRKISGADAKDVNDGHTSGIGLSSVKAMLAACHGGDIMVTNHADGGALVVMTFPMNGKTTSEDIQSMVTY